ncbi:LysR substrate-binding domain-containing protein (plasmid) [Roseomonas sp. OT10]|uniref:LysR substrate-binding domain-containing protein n=1 Tax=Roseomonas cutis TaxID=2897332 RepID=UPI001E61ED73|nr:LysR substrate-binding domain-containing protein [Roseomonas sp. OT10]UFN51545.1 LysR substrate-binding domain-containing protein [Roseomonas sp. OT10]
MLRVIDEGLDLIRAGLTQTQNFLPSESNATFHLLVSDIGEVYYLPRLVSHLRRVAPGVRLRVTQLTGRSHAEMLESSRADLAVGYLARPVGRLRRQKLFSEEFICMCRDGHPGISDVPTLDEYRRAAHVCVSRRTRREEIVDDALARIGLEREVVLTLPHFMAAAAVVSETDLVMTVPRRFSQTMPACAGLRSLPLPFEVPSFSVCMFWHERMQKDKANQWLRRTFADLFRT